MNDCKQPLRVLVVDDSALYRKIVRDVLAGLDNVEVVGVASDGDMALERIATLKPDVVTLDLEMPKLDGLGVLKKLHEAATPPAAIMVSAFTAQGAQSTTAALREGAFDFILKPATRSLEMSTAQLRRDLGPKIDACRARRSASRTPAATRNAAPPRRGRPAAAGERRVGAPPQIVVIGVSTGGPQALGQLIPRLPASFPCPIALVQHMPPLFTASLAEDLNRRSALNVSEGRHGQVVGRGDLVIAPGGKHMAIVRREGRNLVQINDEPPERNCKPSVDYLFRSVAQSHGGAALGVVLTGMGDDGCEGARLLRQQGAHIIAQDEASCVVYGMPKAVIDAGLADTITPLSGMPMAIANHARGAVTV